MSINQDKTITLSELSDPEIAAKEGIVSNDNYSYIGELLTQIKLNLLLSEKLYMPMGFLLDNPALWDLLHTSPNFKSFFIPQSMHAIDSSIVLTRHALLSTE